MLVARRCPAAYSQAKLGLTGTNLLSCRTCSRPLLLREARQRSKLPGRRQKPLANSLVYRRQLLLER